MDDLSQIDDWTCTLCLQEIFPFHTIEDNDEFIAQTQSSHGTMDLFDNHNNVFFEPLIRLIVNKFNDYFVNIGPTLAKSIPNVNKTPSEYMTNKRIHSLFLSLVTESEINVILMSLKDSAPGYDGLKLGPLKIIMSQLTKPLVYICNMSLQEGLFPQELKRANVVPLYKKENSIIFTNYRPVSLLCILSKVFERIMYDRVIGYLEEYRILFEYQFGFRKRHSTYLAFMVLMDKLIKSIENGNHVVAVFLDFSKAFDTVDHSILLFKL